MKRGWRFWLARCCRDGDVYVRNDERPRSVGDRRGHPTTAATPRWPAAAPDAEGSSHLRASWSRGESLIYWSCQYIKSYCRYDIISRAANRYLKAILLGKHKSGTVMDLASR